MAGCPYAPFGETKKSVKPRAERLRDAVDHVFSPSVTNI
jgi:hypothetical protein